MDAVPGTGPAPPPADRSAGAAAGFVTGSSRADSPALAAAWPRSAQLATAFLLGLATALLGVQVYRTLPAGARPAELQRQAILAQRLDLNRAGRVELMQVPGLGERLAERIETHRRQHGPFRRVEDLGDVPGIGPALVERVRPWVYVRADDSELAASLLGEPAEDLDPPAGQPADAARPPSKKEAALTSRINVNTAGPEELQRLPGIGPKLAQRIVEARQMSPFRSVEDLDRVPGIGPKTIEKLRPHVSVNDFQVVTAE